MVERKPVYCDLLTVMSHSCLMAQLRRDLSLLTIRSLTALAGPIGINVTFLRGAR